MSKIFFAILIVKICGCFSAQGPMLIWGVNYKLPSISTPTDKSIKFHRIFDVINDGGKVLLLEQDKLCVEDVSIHNGDAFKKIAGEDVLWIPSVNNMIESVNKIDNLKKTSLLTLVEDLASHRILHLHLDTKHKLNANVAVIEKVMKRIGEIKTTVVLLGEKPLECSEHLSVPGRHLMSAVIDPSSANGTMFKADNETLLYTNMIKVSLFNGGKVQNEYEHTFNLEDTKATAIADNSSSTLTLKFPDSENITDVSLSMLFSIGKLQWTLETISGDINFKDLYFTNSSFEQQIGYSVPRDYSYTCHDQTFSAKKNGTYTIKFWFQGLQVQPAFVKKVKFSSPYDCLGVLSIPLWMGLIVTIFFTLILVAGSMMVMSIKTMDRFDDPKGKTISIPTTD